MGKNFYVKKKKEEVLRTEMSSRSPMSCFFISVAWNENVMHVQPNSGRGCDQLLINNTFLEEEAKLKECLRTYVCMYVRIKIN